MCIEAVKVVLTRLLHINHNYNAKDLRGRLKSFSTSNSTQIINFVISRKLADPKTFHIT